MTTDFHDAQASLLEPEFEGSVPSMYGASAPGYGGLDTDDEPLRPLNWNLLTGDEAESEWLVPDQLVGNWIGDKGSDLLK